MDINESVTRGEDQEFFDQELEEYEKTTSMTAAEKRALLKWVRSGHSLNENPGSRYLADQYPPLDFLSCYRQDKEIEKAIQDMTEDQQKAYLMDYMGWTDDSGEEAIA